MFHICPDEIMMLVFAVPFARTLWMKFRPKKKCHISTCTESHHVPPPVCTTCEADDTVKETP